MSAQIALPQGFGCVPASLISLGWLLVWQTALVARARRRAGIAYPQLYAEQTEVKANPAALQFNCTQRCHQNTLEALPVITLSTLVLGFRFPFVAASLCSGYVLGRVIYTLGYKSGNPSKRLPGAYIGGLSSFGLLFGATYAAYQLFTFV
ncbi:hypothetical protein F5I97DRAFT_1181994 [Phlebopus sp. FC_14]|nr:hypothetical protein F5I97DRAFT_1181994 [Phlebopus sp. FC_14]